MAIRGNELYPTPAPITKALVREFRLPLRVWEPAAGMGHMASVLARTCDLYCSDLVDYEHVVPGAPEIDTGCDFLASTRAPFEGRDWAIVTNPPFAISGDFVRKGLSYCDTVVILNRLQFMEGKARSDILDRHLDEVMVFVNRPPMMHRFAQNPAGAWVEWNGKKADSAITMAWFVFRPEPATPGTFRTRRIRWHKGDL